MNIYEYMNIWYIYMNIYGIHKMCAPFYVYMVYINLCFV